jgi:hypothetical protein
MNDDIEKILADAGYKVVIGKEGVLKAIKAAGGGQSTTPLCSGYRVFPDGSECAGCKDCQNRGSNA